MSAYSLADTNLFAYCGNNPVMRTDKNGEWWIFANAVVGAVIGSVAQIISNVTSGQAWNTGVIGAAVGGAVYGAVAATTGNIVAAAYSSTAAESITNEVISYLPLAKANGSSRQALTVQNVGASFTRAAGETFVNGTIYVATGKFAGKAVKVNSGWFKPKKLVSSFFGRYAQKTYAQAAVQGTLNCAWIRLRAYWTKRYGT